MEINDKVIINSPDGYCGKHGIVKKFSDKTSFDVGVEIKGIPSIIWFSKSELIKY